jgi:hypothetical protein
MKSEMTIGKEAGVVLRRHAGHGAGIGVCVLSSIGTVNAELGYGDQ